MSNIVTNLCRPLQLSPAQKAVLMALADRADDTGVAWPSIAWVSEWTCLGRSTVIRAVNALEAEQLIVMSRAEGRTSRCTILTANVIALTADPSRNGTPTRPAATPADDIDPSRCDTGSDDFGDADPSRSDTGPDAAPVPDRDTHPSRSGTPTRPALTPPRPAAGPDTSINTNKTSDKTKKARAKSSAFDPMTVELPEWLERDVWSMWVKYRAQSRKSMTEDSARLSIGKLAKLRAAGHDPRLVVEAAIENGWQGLYESKDGSTKRRGSAINAGDKAWLAEAGFTHIAEAQNARCHIGNYRQFRDGKRIVEEVHA